MIAVFGGTFAAIASAEKVLELIKVPPPGGTGHELIAPEEPIEVWSYGESVTLSGVTETRQCGHGLWFRLGGHDVTNGERKDTIAITEASNLLSPCGSTGDPSEWEYPTVTGLPVILTLTTRWQADMEGTLTFTFADGCSYSESKLPGTVDGYGDVSLTGTLKRRRGSPKTCDKQLLTSAITGSLERSPGVYVSAFVEKRS